MPLAQSDFRVTGQVLLWGPRTLASEAVGKACMCCMQ
jgi:hypothetical protein